MQIRLLKPIEAAVRLSAKKGDRSPSKEVNRIIFLYYAANPIELRKATFNLTPKKSTRKERVRKIDPGIIVYAVALLKRGLISRVVAKKTNLSLPSIHNIKKTHGLTKTIRRPLI